MRLGTKCVVLFTCIRFLTCASTISFVGPTTPSGVVCDPNGAQCVNGSNFIVYSVLLSQPTVTDPLWTLTIQMNYPNFPTPMGPGNIIPPEFFADGLYSAADFLIQWDNKYYGIPLAVHTQNGLVIDTYQPGNLYQAPNTQFNLVLSGYEPPAPAGVLPFGSFRPGQPVWLAPGGNLLGTGSITVALGGNGTPAQYTITDKFSAPADFLSTGQFTLIADSFVCANGLAVHTGSFESGGGGDVPEPATLLLSIPVVLLLLWPRFGARHYSH